MAGKFKRALCKESGIGGWRNRAAVKLVSRCFVAEIVHVLERAPAEGRAEDPRDFHVVKQLFSLPERAEIRPRCRVLLEMHRTTEPFGLRDVHPVHDNRRPFLRQADFGIPRSDTPVEFLDFQLPFPGCFRVEKHLFEGVPEPRLVLAQPDAAAAGDTRGPVAATGLPYGADFVVMPRRLIGRRIRGNIRWIGIGSAHAGLHFPPSRSTLSTACVSAMPSSTTSAPAASSWARE